MPKKTHPRRGSLQVRPRKRANSQNVRVRSWPVVSDNKILGFAGYKVGMTHIIVTDNRQIAAKKDVKLSFPVTIIECPPLKVIGVRGYIKGNYGLRCVYQKFVDNIEKIDKNISRVIAFPKKKDANKADVKKKEVKEVKKENMGKENIVDNFDEVRILVLTQPSKTSIGKKKPEVFELGLGGDSEKKLKFAEEILSKEIKLKDVFQKGQQVDTVSVTKGKGNQGPVKRFGVKIRFHKSEKTKRGIGSLGPWHGPRLWKVAHAGQTGYHQRTEYNKQILKLGEKVDEINPKGGFLQYGFVKNDFLILKGSIGGPRKRLIKMIQAIRPNKKIPKDSPVINYIDLESKQ
jgi:large subunit ribosomal protein L3